jgi:hypothetical protein
MQARFLTALILLIGIVWLAQQPASRAQLGVLGCGQVGQRTLLFQPCAVAGGGGGYVGPGNVVSGAKAWWGSSGYTSTDTGNAMEVCEPTNTTCVNWAIGASGYVTPALVGGADCTMVTCTIRTFYDRSGSNSCGGAPCNVVETSATNRAIVAFNAIISTIPCAFQPGNSGNGYSIATGFNQSQPTTVLAVTERNSHFTTQGVYLQSNTLYPLLQSSSANTVTTYGGTLVTATASDSAFHSIQAVDRTPNSDFQVDSTQTLGAADPGGGSMSVGGGVNVLFDGGTSASQGYMCDLGIWGVAFSGANLTAMNSNRHAAYGVW